MIDRLEFIDDLIPRGAALNMAIDEALLETLGKTPLLRVYRWARPSVSFGYFDRFAEVNRAFPTHDLVRRWTGGGVVEHGADFTYSVLAPRGSTLAAMRPGDSYREIHEALARGIGAELAAAAQPKVSAACFENPVQHDLLRNGRKIAGAAQRRTRRGLIHQGSVHVPLDGSALAAALASIVVKREMQPFELARAHELATSRYATTAWLERL